jgi:NADH-quinone oxidoreductase subunit A
MLPNYVPILILAAIVFGFAISTVVMSRLIGKPRPNAVKSATYECGVPPIGSARERFPVKFYLVCMIFILFDVDAAFLYPWALVFKDFAKQPGGALFAFAEMGVFILLIGGGFVYAWKEGALDW